MKNDHLCSVKEMSQDNILVETVKHPTGVLEALQLFTVYFPSREAKQSLEQRARIQGILLWPDRCFVSNLICTKPVPKLTEKNSG
jgi:hypothetical protein